MATISLSGTTVVENPQNGTVIGILSVTGGAEGESFTYTLADSLSDRFEIIPHGLDGYALVVKNGASNGSSLFDFENDELNSFALTITATSSENTIVGPAAVTIDVTNVNEAPTGISVTGGSVAENSTVGSEVATLAGLDPDAGDTFDYTLVTDSTGGTEATHALFEIAGDKIVLKAGLNDAQVGPHDLWVKVTDAGGLSTVQKVTITVTDTVETFTGTARNDRISGTIGGDVINGLAGNDKLYGLAGKDILNGGAGKDILYGGADQDTFVFNTAFKKGHFDHVADFKSGEDKLQFDLSALGSLKPKMLKAGKLPKKFFKFGDKAADGNDTIIYNQKNGFLYLDSDGEGGKKGEIIAKLKPGTKVAPEDFLFVL